MRSKTWQCDCGKVVNLPNDYAECHECQIARKEAIRELNEKCAREMSEYEHIEWAIANGFLRTYA